MGERLRLLALGVAALGLAACGPAGGTTPAAGSAATSTTTAAAASAPASEGAAMPQPVPVPVDGGRTASALGIEIKGGTFLPLIERGTALPATHDEAFTTAEDGQATIEVHVFRGDSGRVADAESVGRYELAVPKRQPRGVPQITVTFAVDASGAFRLTAVDKAGGPVTVSMTG